LSSIDFANCTLSPITLVSRGDDLLMSSRASRTAAMMEAAITSDVGRFTRRFDPHHAVCRVNEIDVPL